VPFGRPTYFYGANVRSGSKADMTARVFDVRFTPESGHAPTRSECLLWADIVAKVVFGP